MTRKITMVTIAAAIGFGIMAGIALAHDGNDHHGVAAGDTPGTSIPWDELTGPEKSVIMLQQELAIALDNGAQPGDKILLELEEALARAKDLAAGPPPEPPDPKVVQEILDYESDTEPSWDMGEIPCEGGLGIPDMPAEMTTLRCISVPQLDTNVVVLWLTDVGEAWVYYHRQEGGGLLSDWYDVPVLPDLADADIEVVDQEIQIILPDQTLTFDTTIWRDELAPKSD